MSCGMNVCGMLLFLMMLWIVWLLSSRLFMLNLVLVLSFGVLIMFIVLCEFSVLIFCDSMVGSLVDLSV